MYAKGAYKWSGLNPPGSWEPELVCSNEGVARRGLYEPAFDVNGNGTLEPGIPLSVVSGGKTDALGMTTVTLRYPRDRANG